MLDYYTPEGTEYSKEEVLSAAEAKGLTIDSYIQQYYPEDFTGKQVDSTVDPTGESRRYGIRGWTDGFSASYDLPLM